MAVVVAGFIAELAGADTDGYFLHGYILSPFTGFYNCDLSGIGQTIYKGKKILNDNL